MLEFLDRCPHRSAMISRCIALLSLLALAGCCASGVGCTAGAPGGNVAWDGLGATPEENVVSDNNAPAATQPAVRTRRPTSARPDSQVSFSNEWQQQQASDQNADAKLSRQLKICSNC
jgi:hypothetical protein